MRIFIVVLILNIILQSWTKADDIKDFEIEGISIGDSLLEHYNKEEIEAAKQNYYNDDEFTAVIFDSFSDNYNYIQFHFNTHDKNFIIYSIDGIFMNDNLNDCIKKRNKISNEIADTFTNIEKEVRDNKNMSSDEGKLHRIVYNFTSGDFAEIACYEYFNKDIGTDHGRVAFVTKKLDDWIIEKAHN